MCFSEVGKNYDNLKKNMRILIELLQWLTAVLLLSFRIVGSEVLPCKGSLTQNEYNVLEDLYTSTAGWNWIWNPNQPSSTQWNFAGNNLSAPCTDGWQGLICINGDEDAPHNGQCAVADIVLGHRNLIGELPSSLGTLSVLSVVTLTGNSITGTLPTELGACTRLLTLYLNLCQLTGMIPSQYGNFGDLIDFDLSNNMLVGQLPTELGKLTAILNFYASANSLTGPIPSELGLLSTMLQLSLFGNDLSSTFPTEIALVTGLDELYLYNTFVSGQLPAQLGSMTNMQSLDLSTNLFSSSIPSGIGKMTKMILLYLFQNMFSSFIPPELELLVSLQSIGLQENYLSGSIPSQLGNLVNVSTLYAFSNMLSGPLPASVMLPLMGALDFQYNFLSGPIPPEILHCGNLSLIELSNNKLAGTVPKFPQQLTLVELSDNFLKGTLDFLSDTSLLKELSLADNEFTGTLPSFIGNWPFIQSFNVSGNSLRGSTDVLSRNFSALRILQSADLSQNSFTSQLSSGLFLLPTLQTIVLSQNCFSGSVPDSICMNSNLENIVMDVLTGNCGNVVAGVGLQGFVPNQLMSSSIPSCIWSGTMLKVLHLLGNGLSGSLADIPEASQLQIVAVGSNRLTGTIPISFQTHNFNQLDLSINRISGTLSSNLTLDPNTTEVYYLDTNRISGHIPSTFYQTFDSNVLNVLQSNVFGCSPYDIPASDTNHDTYQCGSTDLQYSLLSWIAAVASGAGLIAIVGLYRNVVEEASKLIKESHRYNLVRLLVWYLFLAATCMIGMFGYLGFKFAHRLQDELSTHSVQYWWSTTVVFLRDWQTVLFLLILLLVSVVLAMNTLLVFSDRGNRRVGYSVSVSVSRANDSKMKNVEESNRILIAGAQQLLKRLITHAINIFILTTVNAIYIIQATNSLTGAPSFAVQACLSLFKLFWSMVAIPRLVYLAHTRDAEVFPDWVFMVLFDFIGAPFASAFCESSACFLDVLTAPKDVSFAFPVPTLLCDTSCNTVCHTTGCTTDCTDSCSFTASVTETGSITPPFIYSYQCSSAVVTNYASVLIFSYVVTGVLIPMAIFVFVAIRNQLSDHLSNSIAGAFSKFVRCNESDEALEILSHSDGNLLKKFGRRMIVKSIMDIVVLLTFGLASPLLAIAVVFQVVTFYGMNIALMDRFIKLCVKGGCNDDQVRRIFQEGLTLESKVCMNICVVMMGFVGIFWSLFVFDMIGDVYGASIAGPALLAPLIAPVITGIIVLKFNERSSGAEVLSRVDPRLSENLNPINAPQSVDDRFDTGDYGHL
jgi:Leucine-rich repeat (LRR) protein